MPATTPARSPFRLKDILPALVRGGQRSRSVVRHIERAAGTKKAGGPPSMMSLQPGECSNRA